MEADLAQWGPVWYLILTVLAATGALILAVLRWVAGHITGAEKATADSLDQLTQQIALLRQDVERRG